MNFRIDAISFQEITAYISGEHWDRAEIIPITPERAGSQQQNPNARPGDPCLWVAVSEEGRVIGFAGSLPAFDVRNRSKMGWNTCWWVDPARGKAAAMPLIYQFLHAWDQKVAFADMTPRTRAIIDTLGFCNTREEPLAQIRIRVPVHKVVSRLGSAGWIFLPFVCPAALLVNGFQQLRMRRSIRKAGPVKTEYMDHLDEEVYGFIRQHQGKDFARRSVDEYRWIEKHPWLVKRSAYARVTGKRYPFSYEVRDYRLQWLVSRREGAVTSVMLVSTRDGAMKVLYYFGKEPGDAIAVLKERSFACRGVHSLIFAHPALVSHAAGLAEIGLRTLYKSRLVGVSRKIMEKLPEEMVIQLGDGDSVFT
jgi:hypothetical protein